MKKKNRRKLLEQRERVLINRVEFIAKVFTKFDIEKRPLTTFNFINYYGKQNRFGYHKRAGTPLRMRWTKENELLMKRWGNIDVEQELISAASSYMSRSISNTTNGAYSFTGSNTTAG